MVKVHIFQGVYLVNTTLLLKSLLFVINQVTLYVHQLRPVWSESERVMHVAQESDGCVSP